MAQRRAITESFDLYPADMNAGGVGLFATWLAIIPGRPVNPFGIVAGRFTGSHALHAEQGTSVQRAFPSTTRTATGFAFMHSVNDGTAFPVACWLGTGGNEQMRLNSDNNGRLFLSIDSVSIAVADNPSIIYGVWHYIEVEYFLHNSVGTIAIYIDGVLVPGLNYTGNTSGGVDIDLANVQLMSGTANFDDMYLEVDGNVRVGEGRMQVFVPNSTVANSGFVQSTGDTIWGVIDDVPLDNTDFASATVAGSYFRCGVTVLPYAPQQVYGVQMESASQKDEAGTRILHNKIWGVTNTLDGTDKAQTLNSFTWNRDWFPLEPDNDGPWTLSQLATVNIGAEIVT